MASNSTCMPLLDSDEEEEHNDSMSITASRSNEKKWPSFDIPNVQMPVSSQLKTIEDQFGKRASESPNKIALVASGRKVTFLELEKWSMILSNRLRHFGVKKNVVVGIFLPKGIDFVVAYLAVVRARGVALRIYDSYPDDILAFVLEDSDPLVVVTSDDLAPRLKDAGFEQHVLALQSANWQGLLRKENVSLGNLPAQEPASLDDLFAVVYSAGTTGKPKGILVKQRAVVERYFWRHHAFPYGQQERIACNVFFVWEFLRPLLVGVPTYIIPDSSLYEPRTVCEFISDNQISEMLFTPSILEVILDSVVLPDMKDHLHSLKRLWLCGELVSVSLLKKIKEVIPSALILYMYSMSETHDVACADLTKFEPDESLKYCPVGKPLPGTYVLVLNDDLKPQHVGVPGEIFIAATSLSPGYIKRADLTSYKFIPRPKSLGSAEFGERLFRTGDWGYVLSDGSLVICGKTDSMIKIRGYPIELETVENAIQEVPNVCRNVVVVRDFQNEEKFLVAYVVTSGFLTQRSLRAELKKWIPFYMIPSMFVFVDHLPDNPDELAKLSSGHRDCDFEGQPVTTLEKTIAKLWCDVLRISAVDVQESFFDLGGHSLLAARLLSLLNTQFNTCLSLRDLFSNPTIQQLADMMVGLSEKAKREHVVEGETGSGVVPYERPLSPLKLNINLKDEVDAHDRGIRNVADLDIQLRAFWRAVELNSSRWFKGCVLLTGSTGFLGAYLLQEILLKTRVRVYCLIREVSGASVKERLRGALKQLGIVGLGASTERLEQRLRNRCVHLIGDVSLQRLGLSEEDYESLAKEIDFVIHAAATVNLVYPYHVLKGVNVVGTENIIRFALTHRIKPIHYVSVDSVFPLDVKVAVEDAELWSYAHRLPDGYSQSKWVAEHLIKRAQERGIPAVVYRCGNIGASRKVTTWNPKDFTMVMIKGCVQLSAVPEIDWLVELTPVDFVAEVIVYMSQHIRLALGKTVHLVNPRKLDSFALWNWMQGQGYALETLSFETWREKLEASGKDCSEPDLELLHDFISNEVRGLEYFNAHRTFRQDNLQAVLEPMNMSYPPTNLELFRHYFKNMTESGSFPKPPKRLSPGPLRERTAFITGGSSGIGRAIALSLAKRGAKVAVGARRSEKLDEIRTLIESEYEGHALPVQVDVTNIESVRKAVDQIEETFGPIDILVNNAGCMFFSRMEAGDLPEWLQQVDVNIKGVLNCLSVVLPRMCLPERKDRHKHIVNISSDAGRKPFPGLAVYSGTKYFIEGMSGALRQEVVGKGIKVTCVQPGDTETEISDRNKDEAARVEFGSDPKKIKFLEPEDVGEAVAVALCQPYHVAMNEILIEPREAPI